MTKYHPIYEVNKIIKSYAVKYNKSVCKVHSLWYFNDEHTFNDEPTEVVICTDKPGVWIGKAGRDIAQLTEDINAAITESNERLQKAYKEGQLDFQPDVVPKITVSLIECNF